MAGFSDISSSSLPSLLCLSQHHDNDSIPSVILRQSLHFSPKIPFIGRTEPPHEYLPSANCKQHHQSSQLFTRAPLAVHLGMGFVNFILILHLQRFRLFFWVDVVVYIYNMIFTHSLGLILWRVDFVDVDSFHDESKKLMIGVLELV
ncbi:hypothetical protein Hanom_Chr04g00358211 [Helianthus anomalus]